MNYEVKTTKQFDKDANLCVRRGYDTTKLREAISLLSETGTLPQRFKPHKITGEYKGAWECHIGPDWLMIYNKEKNYQTDKAYPYRNPFRIVWEMTFCQPN